jgi:hypothetical protein
MPKDDPSVVTPADNLFVAQYNSLRAEILQLQQNNEQRTLGTLGLAVVLWSALATLLGSKVVVPGVAFLGPLPLALAGVNSYVAASRRISNIGAFLGAATSEHAPGIPNWEREVSEYSQQPGNRMSTRMSTVSIYWMMVVIGIVSAITAAAVNADHRSWAWLDLIGSLALGIGAITAFLTIQRSHRAYATTRKELDTYWSAKLANTP